MRHPLIGRICVALCLAGAAGLTACGRSDPAGDVAPAQLRVLGNRADLVSGGDALVEVVMAGDAKAEGITAQLGGLDLGPIFRRSEQGRVLGLVTGLSLGANELTVATASGEARLTIVNHPNGGPVFSGPQILPWPCLPDALDAQCNRPVTYEYRYKPIVSTPGGGAASQNTSPFKDYDPANPPSDVSTATTDPGTTVPYIVRVEHGMQDRGEYRIAVLFDPAQPWTAWAPQKGWNGKTYVTGGSGCGTHHGETAAPDVEVDEALKRGYMVWSTALDHNTQNCNLVVQAESLMMAKERIAEQYGPIRWTIGSGCSGGSIYQQQAANDYPGIFDGILPNCSFPDSWSTAVEVVDCRLLLDYFDDPAKWAAGVAWPEMQQALVAGHPGINICQSWINVYAFDQGGNPRAVNGGLGLQSCNLPAGTGAEFAYDPATNPQGARCDLATYFANQLGPRPPERWGDIEKSLGHGFVQAPYDNIGVQYGLQTLQQGLITPSQFVDLNEKIGGRDIDYNPWPARVEADPFGIAVAYRGGLFNEGNNMHLPIIDLRGHDVAEIHHDYRSYVMRARLDKANGHHDNQVIWTGPVPLVGDAMFEANALTAMDAWLTAIEADTSDLPLERKVVKNKPATAHDLCTDGLGQEIPDAMTCALLNPYYAEPRMVAGEPFTGDIVKCQLRPLSRDDYADATPALSDDEFARLQALFPSGVCDFSKPGVGQQPTIPWMGYAGGPGGVPLF
jgi:hypothetical protein